MGGVFTFKGLAAGQPGCPAIIDLEICFVAAVFKHKDLGVVFPFKVWKLASQAGRPLLTWEVLFAFSFYGRGLGNLFPLASLEAGQPDQPAIFDLEGLFV